MLNIYIQKVKIILAFLTILIRKKEIFNTTLIFIILLFKQVSINYLFSILYLIVTNNLNYKIALKLIKVELIKL